MRLDHFVLSTIVFSLVVVTCVYWIGDTNAEYANNGVNMSSARFTNVYNTINESYYIGESMKNQSIDADISEDDTLESMTRGTYSAIRRVKNTFTLYGDLSYAISSEIGIPTYIVDFGITAILVIVVFGIIFLILRFIPR